MLVESPFFPQLLSIHPFSTINFSDPTDKARHDCMVALVTQIPDLNKRLHESHQDREKKPQRGTWRNLTEFHFSDLLAPANIFMQ